MTPAAFHEEQLSAENADLRARLAQAEETLRAIRSGEVRVEALRDLSPRNQAETNLPEISRRFEIAPRTAPLTPLHQDLDLGCEGIGKLLDNLLRTAPIGFCFLDRDLRFVRINELLAEMSGSTVEAHLGRHVSEMVPSLAEAIREVTGRILATGQAVLNHEFSGETPAAPGVTRCWKESWYPAIGDAGEVVGFGAVIEEITERKQAQANLRASEERANGILASITDGFHMIDSRGHFTLFNDAARAMYGAQGVDADAMVGKHIWDEAFPDARNTLAARAISDSLDKGTPTALENFYPTWQCWFHVRNFPTTDGGVATFFQDITERKQAEQALRESQQFTRSVLDNLFAFVAVTAADGTLIDVNRAPLEAAGMPASEVIGKKFWDCYWWSYSPEIQAQLRGACERAAGGEAVRYDVPVRMAGDKRMWIDFQVAPLRDTQGRITHLIPSAMDMTVRRAAEEKLRASEERFRVAIGAVSDIIWTNSAAGEMEGEQPTWGAFTGQPQEDYRGHGWSRAVHPEDAQPTIDAWDLAVAEKRLFEFAHRVRRHDGAWRLCSIRAVPVLDAGGEILEWVGVHTDITERERVAKMNDALLLSSLRHQETLLASEQRTRLATEATAVGVWEWNVLTNEMRWDAQMFLLYGIPPTADGFVQYNDWSEAVLAQDLPENERILQDTMRRSGQSRREFRIRRRNDGAVRHIEAVEAVRANAQGETEWVVGTNLDVTERKTAEIQLRQLSADLSEADRRKDEFLATLAHELRNPLAPIRTGLQLMKLARGQQATIEQTRSMMERQLAQMVRLVDDLMDVSRISRGKLELQRERVALAAVVNSAVESSSPLIEQMGHQLTVTLPELALMVDADMTRLSQVVLNLLNNAAKYSDQGGHIQLTVERDGGDAVLRVKDTGIGMAAGQLTHVFEMFTQVDQSLERSQGGLGIGLTLVRRLVELHGGVVEARSEGLGKGSEFVVRLPVAVEASKPQAPGVEDEPAATKSSLRILVVDDNQDGADSLSELLKVMGNDTRTAYDGQQGVALAEEYRPDVMLLDIGLPTLNGYEVCHLIRQQPWGQDVLLIAVTGWGQDEDRRRSHEAGFDHHIVKPVDPDALMSTIAMLHRANADQSSNRFR